MPGDFKNRGDPDRPRTHAAAPGANRYFTKVLGVEVRNLKELVGRVRQPAHDPASPESNPISLTNADLARPKPKGHAFSAPGWLFEIKYDGFRCLAIRDGESRMLSRHGGDLARAFPEIAAQVARLPEGTALDGELVIMDGFGHPHYENLRARVGLNRMAAVARAAESRPATLFAWDILYCNGSDIRDHSLLTRKRALKETIARAGLILPARYVAKEGEKLFAETVELDFEGIVAKRASSPYVAGITHDWLKILTPGGRAREQKRKARRH